MSKQIDITQFSFQVFQSKAGNWGARLSNNGFAVCGFLNVATGDALFASHPILGNGGDEASEPVGEKHHDRSCSADECHLCP